MPITETTRNCSSRMQENIIELSSIPMVDIHMCIHIYNDVYVYTMSTFACIDKQ